MLRTISRSTTNRTLEALIPIRALSGEASSQSLKLAHVTYSNYRRRNAESNRKVTAIMTILRYML
jgi:hypothetical protein